VDKIKLLNKGKRVIYVIVFFIGMLVMGIIIKYFNLHPNGKCYSNEQFNLEIAYRDKKIKELEENQKERRIYDGMFS
jgi:hypothetical protein